ncbi:uncharacterized protein LOC142351845 [Convolutriloba macropyga]|uniref:uncharacterized protein LOC142351845 n=1 Tax=Convolutriloba macropyga TaxID=536237 RepID=UPI003F522BC2
MIQLKEICLTLLVVLCIAVDLACCDTLRWGPDDPCPNVRQKGYYCIWVKVDDDYWDGTWNWISIQFNNDASTKTHLSNSFSSGTCTKFHIAIPEQKGEKVDSVQLVLSNPNTIWHDRFEPTRVSVIGENVYKDYFCTDCSVTSSTPSVNFQKSDASFHPCNPTNIG